MVPRLRVKTGCDRCKARHKKCDERKPTCSDCFRLGFACLWKGKMAPEANNCDGQRQDGSGGDGKKALVPMSRDPPVRVSVLGSGYSAFEQQGQYYFMSKCPEVIGSLIPTGSSSVFRDLSILSTLALENAWIRDALAAFAAYMLCSREVVEQRQQQTAVQMYHNAMISIRKRLSVASDQCDRLPLLVAITFLGLFENLGTGHPKFAITHLVAAANVAQQITTAYQLGDGALMLYRICVECWVFGLSTLAVFSSECDEFQSTIDFSHLHGVFGRSRLLDASVSSASPFFLGNHEIYVLMLRCTCLARARAPKAVRAARVAAWSAELDVLERNLGLYYDSYDFPIADLYHAKYLLHIYALRIVLLKIEDNECSSATPGVRHFTRLAWNLLEARDTRERSNPALAWPLTIFLCAAHENEVFDGFVSAAVRIRDNFDEGHRVRFTVVLDILDRLRLEGRRHGAPQSKGHTGLDLLLREGGMFAGHEDLIDACRRPGATLPLRPTLLAGPQTQQPRHAPR